jgi:hypothetical protein
MAPAWSYRPKVATRKATQAFRLRTVGRRPRRAPLGPPWGQCVSGRSVLPALRAQCRRNPSPPRLHDGIGGGRGATPPWNLKASPHEAMHPTRTACMAAGCHLLKRRPCAQPQCCAAFQYILHSVDSTTETLCHTVTVQLLDPDTVSRLWEASSTCMAATATMTKPLVCIRLYVCPVMLVFLNVAALPLHYS